MASTIQLRRRIKTAQNISKTTKALNMIATSKLKRGQDAVLASTPYSQKLIEITQNISQSLEPGDKTAYIANNSHTKKDLYIVISPDKGLCGSMIANLTREFLKQTQGKDCFVITVGKKIEPYVLRSKKHIIASFPIGNIIPSFSSVYPIVQLTDEQFLPGKVDKVYVIYTQFGNVFSQTPNTTQLLPVAMTNEQTIQQKIKAVQIFEPSTQEILPALLRRYLEMTIYHYMLENYASFQAAQMTAMKNATDNAKDIIEDLKLVYNKSRQEKITNELLDISGSAFASSSA